MRDTISRFSCDHQPWIWRRRCSPPRGSKGSLRIPMRVSSDFAATPLRAELAKISAFAPDLFVVALFQHSFFDEICLSKLPRRVKVAGFRCTDAFWSTQANTRPQEMAERFSIPCRGWDEPARVGEESLADLSDPGHPRCRKAGTNFAAPERARAGEGDPARAWPRGTSGYWVVCAGARAGPGNQRLGRSELGRSTLRHRSEKSMSPCSFWERGRGSFDRSNTRCLAARLRALQSGREASSHPGLRGNHRTFGGLCRARLRPDACRGCLRAAISGDFERLALGPLLSRNQTAQ